MYVNRFDANLTNIRHATIVRLLSFHYKNDKSNRTFITQKIMYEKMLICSKLLIYFSLCIGPKWKRTDEGDRHAEDKIHRRDQFK